MAARLEARKEEIEETILQRMVASLEDREANNPEYEAGLRRAVPAGAGYGIAATRLDNGEVPPIPIELLSQARTAAKHQVPVGAVYQRYIAAQSIFNQSVLDEADKDRGLFRAAIHQTASVSLAFHALTAAVSSEYARAARSKPSSLAAARLARLTRLLDGEPARTDGLEYDFTAAHIGAVAEGAAALPYLRSLATTLNGQLLIARPRDDTIWGWLGLRKPPPWGDFLHATDALWPGDCLLGFGELSEDMLGWRRSHEQARVAFSHAANRQVQPTHYSHVAIAHSIRADELLYSSIRNNYLAPLETGRDGGSLLRDTLRAYFDTGCNRAAAAAALGVSRRTVSNRLNQAEARVGRPVHDLSLELQLALRVSDLDISPG